MTKNKMIKKTNVSVSDDFDFSDFMDPCCDDEMISDVMKGMIDASNNQMKIALELTRIAVEKNTQNITTEDVFSIFQRASIVTNENSPLKALWAKLPKDD